MKKILSWFLLSAIVAGTACKKSDNTSDPGGGTPPPPPPENLKPDIRGVISQDQHWTKDKTYRLRGYVYVNTGVTLTIDAGTKIIS
ncbi:MAG: hypothetical protein ABUT20_59115, partial [Bacteroidota bacterium]